MRNSTSSYTSTCDKCGKTQTSDNNYPALHSIYLKDLRGSFASSDCHQHFMDLCEDCFNGFIQYLGAETRWAEKMNDAKRYQNYQIVPLL